MIIKKYQVFVHFLLLGFRILGRGLGFWSTHKNKKEELEPEKLIELNLELWKWCHCQRRKLIVNEAHPILDNFPKLA